MNEVNGGSALGATSDLAEVWDSMQMTVVSLVNRTISSDGNLHRNLVCYFVNFLLSYCH